MSRMRKLELGLFILLALLLAISLVAIGCPTPPETTTPPAPPAAKILKIGQCMEMTGPIAPGIEKNTYGLLACADWINDNGGITINGQQYLIQIVSADNKCTPEGTIAAANKLIYEEQVKFIIGPVVPWLSIAMTPVCEEARVLRCLFNGTGGPDEMNPNMPLTFCAFFELTYLAPAYDYLVEAYPEVKRIAIVGPDEPGGNYFSQISKKEAEAHGLEVVFLENYVIGTEDFYPLWTKMQAAEPDAVELGVGIPIWYAGIIKAGRDLGFTGSYFSGSTFGLSDVLNLIGRDYAYDIFTIETNTLSTQNPPVVNELKKRVEAKYGVGTFHVGNVIGWNPLWSMVQAIEAAQSLDPTEVAKTWENMKSIETLFGTATMGGLEFWGINHGVMLPRPLTGLDNGELKDIRIVTPRFPKK